MKRTIAGDTLKNYIIGYTDWLKSHERFKIEPSNAYVRSLLLGSYPQPAYPHTELELIQECEVGW